VLINEGVDRRVDLDVMANGKIPVSAGGRTSVVQPSASHFTD